MALDRCAVDELLEDGAERLLLEPDDLDVLDAELLVLLAEWLLVPET